MRIRFTSRKAAVRPQQTRLGFESLEDRWVPSTLFVDDDGGRGKFTSIQAAVNAAKPGDTILVAPGTYTEQVVVPADKDRISIISERPQKAVIKEPATLSPASRSIVDVKGADDVTIAGFTIKGPGPAFAGVQVEQGGSATIANNAIKSIRQDPLNGVQGGIGVVLGGGGTPGSATIVNNTITDYQKEGITVAYSGSSAVIVGNTITGSGPTDVIAQNGIDVNTGADAYIAGNRISKNLYTVDDSATGIGVVQAGHVTVLSNQVTNNSQGIVVQQTDDPSILLNEVRGSRLDGIDLLDVRNGTVAGNRVNGSGQSGLFVTGDSSKNLIAFNDLRGNAGTDAVDTTTGTGTAGTANTWVGNQLKDSLPPGLGSGRGHDHGKD